MVEFKARRQGVSLQKKLKFKEANVEVDKTEMNQVFLNLFSNAVDAMADKPGSVTVEGELADNMVVLKIIDEGFGIPKENLANIFDMFYTTKEQGKGTGLGLSIVYNIVNNYNGSISVESPGQSGTVVTIVLPTTS